MVGVSSGRSYGSIASESVWCVDTGRRWTAGKELVESDSSLLPDSTYEDFRYRRGMLGFVFWRVCWQLHGTQADMTLSRKPWSPEWLTVGLL